MIDLAAATNDVERLALRLFKSMEDADFMEVMAGEFRSHRLPGKT